MNLYREMLRKLRGGESWIKGNFVEPGAYNNRYCLVGAYRFLMEGGIGVSRPVYEARDLRDLRDVIREQYPDRVDDDRDSIINFNDYPETTWADVERVLEKAAIKQEERCAR